MRSSKRTISSWGYLREALIFPLYDPGNIGMQMRKIWGVRQTPNTTPERS